MPTTLVDMSIVLMYVFLFKLINYACNRDSFKIMHDQYGGGITKYCRGRYVHMWYIILMCSDICFNE